ncbi:rhomboid family intramembrane serine protease [Psychroserpens sp. NJDZ02]|uniref:rhomboid family intramembrane serine protease n=1 Tax=Psychroserpens sp. NJDZ02 TaxID=2570561 RepID=UPI0010A92CD0|nr:rhomboid family intramembrane serine protease [Psychroserpens sp. NJDZ02]QCE41890.1 rhomboid family intramembrane serine protease [Psychroserpens sp. NJDZ02]
MKQQEPFQFTLDVIAYPITFVMLLWLIFAIEIRFGFSLNFLGIFPQKLSGLIGVFFSPFIHSGIAHLWHNTIPLFVLSTALFYFYRPIAFKVLFYGIILSGVLTWCIGRPSYHIGASGLIYVLASFIFFKGVFAKHYRLIALSLLVAFLYGSMIWNTLPLEDGISWEGHLSGLLVGLFFALLFKKQIAKPKRYVWEESDYNEENDEFLQHFDEQGNFIERVEEEGMQDNLLEEDHPITYHYIFKENKDL